MGDSITYGWKIAGGYRERLEYLLNQSGIAFDFVGTQTSVDTSGAAYPTTTLVDRNHEGWSGYVINQGQDGIGSGVGNGAGLGEGGLHDILVSGNRLGPSVNVDIVCLMIGVNDIAFNVSSVASTANQRLNNLVQYIKTKKPNIRIVVSTITPFRDNPAADATATSYNAALQDSATGVRQFANVSVVDANAALRNTNGTINTSLYPSNDGIHPNKTGYDIIADTFFAGLKGPLGAVALDQWRQTNFATTSGTGNAANLADPDGDGIVNLLEYATNTSPNTANAASPVLIGTAGGKMTLSFTRLYPVYLTYTVEASSDLSTWSAIATLRPTTSSWILSSGVTANDVVITSATHYVTVTDSQLLSQETRRFLRLRVKAP